MHMRTKKWAKPELEVCPYFTNEPETKRGHWREQFKKDQPLYLELGCGISMLIMSAVLLMRNSPISTSTAATARYGAASTSSSL